MMCARGNSWVPFVLRFLFSQVVRRSVVRSGARLGARVGAGASSRSGVSSGIKFISVESLGLAIAGVSSLSASAAEDLQKYNCEAICVRGSTDFVELSSGGSIIQSSANLSIDFVDVKKNKVEEDWGIYIAPGEFRYSIDFPRSVPVGVKRVVGYSEADDIAPFSSPNILLTTSDHVRT